MPRHEIEIRAAITLTLAFATVGAAIGMPWPGFLGWTIAFALLSGVRYAWARDPK